MSVESTRQSLNLIDKELVSLENKSADFAKKEVTARGNAARTAKSIPKNASLSILKTKQAQIDRHNAEAVKALSSKSDIDKKIADKRKRRVDIQLKLQREESIEQKKRDKAQSSLQRSYEQRIDQLSAQVTSARMFSPPTNLYSERDTVKYDVFISHASEDKETIAESLYKELETRNIKVWYDDLSIQWGDSLRSKIDDGLRNSKFGIVILSNDYIRKGWTQYELDALFQIEMTGGKTLLPIWHKITKDEVQMFSPTLAGRKALNTAMLSASEIADELIKLLSSFNIEDESSQEKTDNG